ncbi:hypothetical protein B4135_1853 [Caldibacillus debilis]|uniref:Uncharacterized protein n=1 Tax=Caldibacillus debilis TaxID=301148 RepID=A0A150M8K3_9BACI|nr:hypothetical protein B4135_1853 [Caldibacillus debilis]
MYVRVQKKVTNAHLKLAAEQIPRFFDKGGKLVKNCAFPRNNRPLKAKRPRV